MKTMTIGDEVFEIKPLSESEKRHRINELSKKKKNLDFDKVPLDDQKTWDLICEGFTKGVFQLEKSLGKRYCKEIKPRNIGELADVISLIRPGCLEAEFREKPEEPGEYSSITHTYIKVKNGTWHPEYIHECLEPIFEDTYSVPIYQEQIMQICSDFAGFTLQEADIARKAVGKKDKKKMAKVHEDFIKGAVANGHDEELAETIFGWIDKFSGYGFNKSHAVSYAMISYMTAYAKVHHPIAYFRSMFENSSGKQDSLEEIHELVHEARFFGIEVKPPSLKAANVDFAVVDDNAIAFGLAHIKGVGAGAITSIENISAKTEDSISFLKEALGYGDKSTKLKSNVAEALIKSGCLDYLGVNRVKLLAEYRLLKTLTKREATFVFDKLYDDTPCGTVKEAYLALMETKIPNKSRKPRIKEAVADINRDLAGNAHRMKIAYEKHLLGIPLSGSLVELYYNPVVNTKCADIPQLAEGAKVKIGVVIDSKREFKDKNENWMAFISVSDETYMCESVVVFASTFPKVAWILEEGNPVLITGKKNRGGIIANKIEHL